MQKREQELEKAASEALAASSAAEAEHAAEEERLGQLRQELEDLGQQVLMLRPLLSQQHDYKVSQPSTAPYSDKSQTALYKASSFFRRSSSRLRTLRRGPMSWLPRSLICPRRVHARMP